MGVGVGLFCLLLFCILLLFRFLLIAWFFVVVAFLRKRILFCKPYQPFRYWVPA